MRFLYAAIGCFICSACFSQNTLTAIVKDAESNRPLVGASAFMKSIGIGASADSAGVLIIATIPDGPQEITFSHVGYFKKNVKVLFPMEQRKPLEIYLDPESEALEDVVVTSTRTNSRIADSPIRVEVIAGEELSEKDDMRPANISMLLTEATGIQTQQTSAVNGNVSIRLLGLDGKYTQILKDGFPLFSGFAQGLSIMQIPPMDLKQVEIIKGSSSSLYGSDAIAGIINLISKQPTEKGELNFLLNQTSLLGSDLNGYFAKRWKKFGLTVLSGNGWQQPVDVNKDGFTDLPKTKTFTVNTKLYYYFNPSTSIMVGVNKTDDDRTGGDMQVVKEEQPDSSHQYFEENVSRRISTQVKFNKDFKSSSNFSIKNSINFFDRSLGEPLSEFKGAQVSSYSEVAYSFKKNDHQWVTGAVLLTENFTEDSTRSHTKRDYAYWTMGLFVQDDWKLSNPLSLQVGIRSDFQSKYGSYFLPRLSLMYKFSEVFYLRAGSGLGYKIPTIFSTAAEQEGLNLIQPLGSNVKVEKSVGYNFDANYNTRIEDEILVTFNQTFFTTQITDPLVLESTTYVNKDMPIVTSGFESSVRFRWKELRAFAGYTFVDARRKYDAFQSFVPITPKHKLVTTVVYEKEKDWMVGFEGFYTSTMYRDNDTNTQAYFIMGLVAQKHFDHFTIVVNCENITDQRQTRFENIVIPPPDQPSFRQVYAPLDGRVFNVALRIKLLNE